MDKRTLQDIHTLMELFDNSDWRELSLEVEEFSLHLSRDADATGLVQQSSRSARERPPGVAADASPSVAADASAAIEEPTAVAESHDEHSLDGLAVIRAPNLGLFYRAPKPGTAAYVQVGEEVSEDTEVCLIEVMKLFTPVVAGVAGTVRSICVEDGALVEYDQPLFTVELQS